MVVGFFSLLGSLTGILVETSIAAKLSLSRSSDTFYVAFTLPYIIVTLLSATGQFSLVPFFSTLEAHHSEEEAWRGFSYAVNLLFLGSSAVAIAGAAAAPWVIRAIAPGFSSPQTELATQLSQWLFLIIIPASLGEAFRSFLLSRQRFALASAAGFVRNLTVILAILMAFERYGMYSIVIGYFAGLSLQFAVLAAQTLFSFRVRYSLTLVGSGEVFRNLHGAGAAQVGGALAWQVVVVAERIIASFLPAGTLTALNYGYKILATVAELLAGSVGTASLPALSRAVARKAASEERKTFQHTLEIGLALVSPVMVFCLILPRPIIRLIFQHGNFTPTATALLSAVFFYYSLSLLPFAGIRVLTFYLFARREARAFVRLSTLQFALNIIFDLVCVVGLRLGAKGIPLGMLASLLVTCGLAFQRDLAGLMRRAFDRSLAVFTLKVAAGAALAALAVVGLRFWVRSPQTGLEDFLYLCELCGSGSLVFVGALAALRAVRISELPALWRNVEGE
jgi:putative peptidoglycan lipid II flippase